MTSRDKSNYQSVEVAQRKMERYARLQEQKRINSEILDKIREIESKFGFINFRAVANRYLRIRREEAKNLKIIAQREREILILKKRMNL